MGPLKKGPFYLPNLTDAKKNPKTQNTSPARSCERTIKHILKNQNQTNQTYGGSLLGHMTGEYRSCQHKTEGL